MMYPITLSALVALDLAARSARRLWAKPPRVDARVEAGVDGVHISGGFALLLGLLGTVIGIAMAAQAIEMVGEVHPTLVWGGIRLTLLTTIRGAVILAASAASWHVLQAPVQELRGQAGVGLPSLGRTGGGRDLGFRPDDE